MSYVKRHKALKSSKKMLYFNIAILEDNNFRGSTPSLRGYLNRLTASKSPFHMLEDYINWKEKRTKKVDTIQNDRIDELKEAKDVNYFKRFLYAWVRRENNIS